LVDVSTQQLDDRFVGLGEMSSSEYPSIFNHRQILDDVAIHLADQIWSCYCSNDHTTLKQFLSVTNPVFPKLNLVLTTHFQRLPTSICLAQIDVDILQFIQESEPSEIEVVGHMLRRSDKLGIGDLQWHWHLNQLDSLYHLVDGKLILNSIGSDLLEAPQNLQKYLNELKHIYNYRYGHYVLNKVFD